MGDSGCRPWPAAGLSRRVAESTGTGFLLPGRRVCSGWLAGREGLQAGDRGGDVGGPGPSFGEAAAAADEPSGYGEDAQAHAFRFSAVDGAGESEHLSPGEQLAG